jgi:creatinine amidohydrolase
VKEDAVSPVRKHELAKMTYKEAESAFRDNPVILIPMGSTEQHGPQCPMGDFRIANALSLELAVNTGSISAPVIPYSEGAAASNFPGAIPLRPETVYNVVWDVCQGFFHSGLDHIMLICGDHGNVPILERMTRDLKDKEGIRVAMVEQFRWFTPELLEELYNQPSPPIAHGGDPVTSLNLHLFPDDVRIDLIQPPERKEFQGLKFSSLSTVNFDDHMFYLPLDYDEVSPSGVLGDASIATKEVGEKIWKHFIQKGTEIVERFKKIETRCEEIIGLNS